MSFFNNYPYTDFHELNLDWVLKYLKELDKEWDEFKVLNTITIQGVWDISKNYPKYSIVEDNGTGYLSLKPVPAGILISNLDYWLPVGTYSTVIADLNTRLTAAEGNITTLQGTVAGHTTAINNLSNYVKKVDLLNGTIICIGDSYLQGFSPDGNVTSWGERLKTFLGKSNSDFKSFAAGGAGFVHPGQNSKRFENLIQDAINDASINNNNVTCIIIGGGWNDAYAAASSSDIYDRMQNCKNLIETNFPYAKTTVAFIAQGQSPESAVTSDKYYNTVERYAYAAAYAHFSYLDNIGMTLKGVTNCLSSDGIHPNDQGQQFIALSIGNYLRTGTSIVTKQIFNAPNTDSIYTLADEYTYTLLHYETTYYTPSLPTFTCDGTTAIATIDLSQHGIKPLMTQQFSVFTTHGQIYANGKYYSVVVFNRINYDGIMELRPMAMAADGSGYLSLTNVTNFGSYPYMQTFARRFI